MSSNGSLMDAKEAKVTRIAAEAIDTGTSRSTTPESLTVKHTSSFPWILHHILENQVSTELPLRIMFTFNAGQQLPTLKQANQWWQYEPNGKLVIEFLTSLQKGSAQKGESTTAKPDELSDLCEFDKFMDANHQLLFDIDMGPDKVGRRIEGLPTRFIENICLNKVFKQNYDDVDFNQALTCLDYLRDLECTRRNSLREAALTLGISKENWRNVLAEEPEAYRWVSMVQKQELAIESSYAAVFIDLRIWTMVHELQSEPFYKPNVLAMLNTLFPPSMKEMPNDKVDIKTLNKYRTTFYHYILAVESKGTGIVKEIVEKLLDPKTKHSWPETRNHLEGFITLADSMIKEAKAVDGLEFFRDTSSSHSRTISAAQSSFSDGPLTASSANTSLDGRPLSFTVPNSPVATYDSSRGKSTQTKLTSNLFEANSIFVPLPFPPIANDPHKDSPYATPRQRAASTSPKTSTETITPSIMSKSRNFSKITPLAVVIPPSSTKASHEKYSPSHPSLLADPEMCAHKRSESSTLQPVDQTITKIKRTSNKSPISAATSTSKKGRGFAFLSHPFQSAPAAEHPPNLIKKKKSFGDFVLRRKPSTIQRDPQLRTASATTPAHGRSSSESPAPISNRLRKQKSLNHVDKNSRARTWNTNEMTENTVMSENQVELTPLVEAKKEIRPRRSLARLPRTPKTPKTPSFQPPSAPSSQPKGGEVHVETSLATLGFTSIDIKSGDEIRDSAAPPPLNIKKNKRKSKEEVEVRRMEEERRRLIAKSREREGEWREFERPRVAPLPGKKN